MSPGFFENAMLWVLGLLVALIGLVYKLFSSTITYKAKIQKTEIKNELTVLFEEKFGKEIKELKMQFEGVREELNSFKRHENRNADIQVKLLKRVLAKLDHERPDIIDSIVDNM